MGRVAWGTDDYQPDVDAAGALAATKRAGAPSHHSDTPHLAELVADALVDVGFKTWDFGDSVAFEALIHASDSLHDPRWASFAYGYGRAWATRSRPFARLDCTVPGRALVTLAVRHADKQLLDTLVDLADYLMVRPTVRGLYETWESSPLLTPYSGVGLNPHAKALLDRPPAGVFVDCLHFDPPFLTALGNASGDERYLRAGVSQALGYIDQLQQGDGLFDHFILAGEPGSFGPGWGRGQGWAILGLLEVALSLEESSLDLSAESRKIRDSAAALLAVMLELQRKDGHWYAVVDDDTSGDEFSTAGFMAWALDTALRNDVVSGDQFELGQRAARGAVLASLDSQAQLREVSAAVYASTEPSHYGRVPRGYVVPWGQGPALLALLAKGDVS